MKVESGDKSVATAAYANRTVTIAGVKAGKTKVTVSDRSRSVSIAVTVSGTTTPPPPPSSTLPWRVLAANDLGMHCADLDYQIFSILPPFNVVHAQVVQTGTASTRPRLLSGADAEVYCSATAAAVKVIDAPGSRFAENQ